MQKMLKASFLDVKQTRNLTTISILIGFGILSSLYFYLPFGNSIQIGFSFLFTVVVGYLYGPVASCMSATVVDIIMCIIKPTGPYFFGFTFSSMVVGFIYGAVLYKKPIKFSTIIIARVLVVIIVSIILNTSWLSILYGKGFFVLLPARVFRNFVTVPIEVMLMYAVLKTVKRIKKL